MKPRREDGGGVGEQLSASQTWPSATRESAALVLWCLPFPLPPRPCPRHRDTESVSLAVPGEGGLAPPGARSPKDFVSLCVSDARCARPRSEIPF